MSKQKTRRTRSNFRKFFLRGLAIVLPTVLTIGILIWAYHLVRDKIAQPINNGVKQLILVTTPWPAPTSDVGILADPLPPAQRTEWRNWLDESERAVWSASGETAASLRQISRDRQLNQWWAKYALGLDLIGLGIAIILIYTVGALLGSFIGRRLYQRGEELLQRVPLIRQVYPSVKQVTDFLVGTDKEKIKFSRVVAVEYPRKGVWSVGLLTGDTMHDIKQRAGGDCHSVFIPSSPTPFTGYVITVPLSDTIDLPITIEQALRFTVSGGVIVPPSQMRGPGDRLALDLPAGGKSDTVAVANDA